MGFLSEKQANINARYRSKSFGIYYSVFEYKGRWYLTDFYDRSIKKEVLK